MTIRLTKEQRRCLQGALDRDMDGGDYSHLRGERVRLERLRKRRLLRYAKWQQYGPMRFYKITKLGRQALAHGQSKDQK